MVAVIAGLLGAIVGWLLKTISDLLSEQRANKRADLFWRREKYVDGVAELLLAGRALMHADSRMSRALFALMNAENGRDPAIIEQCRIKHDEAIAEQEPWTTATQKALATVRLYAPRTVIDRADAAWEAIHNGGSFPEPTEIRAFESSVNEALERLRTHARMAAGLT